MQLYLKDLAEKQKYIDLPFATKFQYFFTKKKRRFFYMFLAGLFYHYHERMIKWVRNKRERVINKYKRRFITRYNHWAITYQTVNDAAQQSEKFSVEQLNRLCSTFLKGEKLLTYGFSR